MSFVSGIVRRSVRNYGQGWNGNKFPGNNQFSNDFTKRSPTNYQNGNYQRPTFQPQTWQSPQPQQPQQQWQPRQFQPRSEWQPRTQQMTTSQKKPVLTNNISFMGSEGCRVRASHNAAQNTVTVYVEKVDTRSYLSYEMDKSVVSKWLECAADSKPGSLPAGNNGVEVQVGQSEGALMLSFRNPNDHFKTSVSAAQSKLFEAFLAWSIEELH